ncbi:Pkinase-domain-containing protein [Cucurbitaria berberidis CBS 394.84]|uniref:Pkinase-domain-containing protein n=1 Tax=Cucurbitaria berberidis CBS 394.84 TaxID=1168544 RepID=A0A9P4GSC6_9PLEO|nr:Pkinase-domain-containing protein [Cucurbitaria berberidis CBS 394.84]KAF1850860.1 Pkinase-domain-containing protein [Cucurbitaria berberidis CBS 394.84]
MRAVGDEPYESCGRIEICGNEQFHVGRDTELCRYSWADDLTISRKHLRIHCILYEQDPVANIAPFVYATDLSANGTYLRKRSTKCTASQGPGILMGPNCTFLLDDGDELRISDTVTLIYRPIKPVDEVKLTPIQEREQSVFASRYLVTGRLLGEGGYGKVLVGIHQETQRQLACKIIKLGHMYEKLVVPNLRLPTGGRSSGTNTSGTRKRWPTKVANCFREFDILKDVSHPNIVALQKVFWSHDTIYIFQELVTGGDLFSFLEYKGGRLDNVQAAVIIRQILKGVKYLHDQEIVHRDLKPDNILMTSLEDGARVVITDFGNARFLPEKKSESDLVSNRYQRMFSYVGTLEFAAPEIHRANRAIPAEDGYSKSVDMWSIGSITATILTGDAIFTDRTHPNYYDDPRAVIISLAAICDLSVLDDDHHPLWSTVSDRPKSFIKSLLVLEEGARLTASEALAHSWFSCYAGDFEDLYSRSIEDWEPRQNNVQLVERISKLAPNLALVGNTQSQEVTSRFFAPRQPGQTDDMLQKLSTSQRWRANTPLPSIREDYETAQFASQVQPPSSESNFGNNASQRDTNTYSVYDKKLCGESKSNNSKSQLFDADGSQKRAISTGHSLNQRSSNNAAVLGTYHRNEVAEDEDSYGSGESLNRAMHDYSQQGYCITPQPQIAHQGQESILVGETPQAKEESQRSSNTSQQPDESYQQTQFPDEYGQQQAPAVEQDSVVVSETPLDVCRQYTCSSHNSLPSYENWFNHNWQANGADVEIDAEDCSKRRRLSHYRH